VQTAPIQVGWSAGSTEISPLDCVADLAAAIARPDACLHVTGSMSLNGLLQNQSRLTIRSPIGWESTDRWSQFGRWANWDDLIPLSAIADFPFVFYGRALTFALFPNAISDRYQ
jgi:hypothetical protein